MSEQAQPTTTPPAAPDQDKQQANDSAATPDTATPPKAPEAPASEVKTFSLKDTERQLIAFMQQHHQAVLVGYLSVIAGDRLGQTVDQLTQFELTDNYKEIKITQLPPPPAPVAPPEAPAPPAPSPVVPAA